MKLVPESLNEIQNFERGQEPKKAMGLGSPYKSEYKSFEEAKIGDPVIDWYQMERGVIIDKLTYKEDPDYFIEVMSEYSDEETAREDVENGYNTIVQIKGPELGLFGGPGEEWVLYDVDGGVKVLRK